MSVSTVIALLIIVAAAAAAVLKATVFKGPKWQRDMRRRTDLDAEGRR